MSPNDPPKPNDAQEVETWLARVEAAALETPATWEWAAAWRTLEAEPRRALYQRARSRCIQLGREAPPKAIALAEWLLDQAGDDAALQAQAVRARAVANHLGGTQFAAREDFERALELHAAAGEELEVAITHRSLVEVCHLLGENAAALDHAERAREHFTREGHDVLLAELEVNVGNVYVRRGEGPSAREHYSRARELFAAAEQPLGLAFCEFNLGLLALRALHLDEAEAKFAVAREGMQAAGFQIHVADCDYHGALIQLQRGAWRSGLAGLKAARERYREVGKPSGPGLCELDLAQAYLNLGALDDAADAADRARAELEPLGLEFELAQAQLLAARIRAERGELSAASEGFEAARARFLDQENLAGACYARLSAALVELDGPGELPTPAELDGLATELERSGQAFLVELARLAAARAAERCEGVEAARERLRAAFPLDYGRGGQAHPVLRAEAWVRLGDVSPPGDPLALEALGAAVAWTESSTGQLPDRELRSAFLSGRRRAHDEYARRLCESERADGVERAVQTLARGRGLARREARVRLIENGELRAARVDLEALAGARLSQDLGLGQRSGAPVAAPTDDDLRAARERYDRLRRERRGPTAWGALSAVDPAARLQPGEEVWAYLRSRRGWSLLRGRHGVAWEHLPLDLDSAELNSDLERLDHHLQRSRLRGPSPTSTRALDALLERLGERLLPADLDGLDTLHVVPVGALHQVPFAALRSGGRALVERACLGVHADFHEWSNEHEQAPWSASGRALWVGRDAEGLDHATAELDALQRSSPLRGERVGLDGVLAALSDGEPLDWVHLAVHGSNRLGGQTLVGLGDGERFLVADELQGLDAPVGVAFLGACDSGRLPDGGAVGIGLRPAFLRAGARTVVSSLWPLDDRYAAEFGLAYHNEMLAGAPAGPCLARLQRQWLAAGRPLSDWGPWQVAGRVMFQVTPV
ncbi:MAG: CHAT domain-containing protein [Planctomycetota bacterium]